MTILEVHNAIGFSNEEDNWELVLSKEHNTHWFSNFKNKIEDMKTLCKMINSDDIQELLFTKEVKTDRPN